MTNEIALSENNTPTGKNNRSLIFHILVTHNGLTGFVWSGYAVQFKDGHKKDYTSKRTICFITP